MVAAVAFAAVIATASWAALRQIYYVGNESESWIVYDYQDRVDSGWNYNGASSVGAQTGQYSSTECSGCLVNAYLVRTNGTRPCDGTAYGHVYCWIEGTTYSRAHCYNPTSSWRWFQCWKWTGT